jgi:hypothetical protein
MWADLGHRRHLNLAPAELREGAGSIPERMEFGPHGAREQRKRQGGRQDTGWLAEGAWRGVGVGEEQEAGRWSGGLGDILAGNHKHLFMNSG